MLLTSRSTTEVSPPSIDMPTMMTSRWSRRPRAAAIYYIEPSDRLTVIALATRFGTIDAMVLIAGQRG